MKKPANLKLVFIVLIVLLLGATAYFYSRYQVATFESKQADQEEATVVDQSTSETEMEEPVEPETVERPYLEGKAKGEHLVNYYDRTIHYTNAATGEVTPIYQVEEPWYVLGYDLAANGQIAVALEKSTGTKKEETFANQSNVILLQVSEGKVKTETLIDRKSKYTDNLYEIEQVFFTANGKYLVVDDRGRSTDEFELFAVDPVSTRGMMKDIIAREKLTEKPEVEFVGVTEQKLVFQVPGEVYVHEFATKENRKLEGYQHAFTGDDGEIYGVKINESGQQLANVLFATNETAVNIPAEIDLASLMPKWDNAFVDPILNTGEREKVTVSSVDELLQAVGSGRIVELAEGTYDLSELASFSSDHVTVESTGITLRNLENFTLMARKKADVKLLTKDKTRPVLKLTGCKEISIIGLMIGTEGLEKAGTVLEIADSSNVSISNSLIYGAQQVGIGLSEVSDFLMNHSVVTDSRGSIIQMEDSEDVRLVGGRLLYNAAVDQDLLVVKFTNRFTLEQVEVTDNSTKGAIFNVDAMSEVSLKDSSVQNNAAKVLTYSKDAILVENSQVENNNFTN